MTDEKKKPFTGCGAEASRICFRGAVHSFLCDRCPYEGGGRVMPYRTAVEGEERPANVYSGVARKCGESVAR